MRPPRLSIAACAAARRFDPPSFSKPFAPSAVYETASRYFGIASPSRLSGGQRLPVFQRVLPAFAESRLAIIQPVSQRQLGFLPSKSTAEGFVSMLVPGTRL